MATKDGKWIEIRTLRSSRRSKEPEMKQEKKIVAQNLVEQPKKQGLHHQIEDQKEQQITPKNDKENAIPSNNQLHPLRIREDSSRRLTRSSALLPKKIISEPELPQDQVTPEDNPVQIQEEESTCKKMLRAGSYAWLSEGASLQLLGTARKGGNRVQSVVSPFNETRKSYRKIHRKEIISIPYRKCHDAFQGRIVTLINKIDRGKNCFRDFESLIDKIQRISPKDMINRYIISGISTIARLTTHSHADDPLRSRFQREQSILRVKIEEQLDRTDDFQHYLLPENQQVIDSQSYRKLTIRKLYKFMRKKFSHHCVREMREKVMKDCERHFIGEANVGSLVKFIRQKMQGHT